jgi:hypothetical protein
MGADKNKKFSLGPHIESAFKQPSKERYPGQPGYPIIDLALIQLLDAADDHSLIVVHEQLGLQASGFNVFTV